MQETRNQSLGQEDPPGEGNIFLPGKFHGQRSLAGSSPWGSQKEMDRTQQLSSNNQIQGQQELESEKGDCNNAQE